MKKIKPKTYTKAKKLICGWKDETNFILHFEMLKLYVRHVMIVDEIHEKNFFTNRLSGWKNI